MDHIARSRLIFQYIVLWVITLCTLFIAGLNAAHGPLNAGHSPFHPGRLICAFHEFADPGQESPTQEEVGALTMRTAAAIDQQAGIIVMSPSLWANIHSRRLAVDQGAHRLGSKYHTMTTRWQNLQRSATSKNFNALHAVLRNHPNTLNTLFLWHLDLSNKTWLAFVHTPSSMIVLIPRAYAEQRLTIVPRLMAAAHTPIEYATGLRLSECTPIDLPAREDERGTRRLLRQAKQLHERTRFSIKNLSELFLSVNELAPPFITSWHVYTMGHGMMHKTKSAWAHLKRAVRNQPTVEHMCGLAIDAFRSLLSMFEQRLRTGFVYYQSCYGGGHNLAQHYAYNTQSREQASSNLKLSFPLVAGALADAPVTALMPRYTQQSFFRGMRIIIDVNLPLFFDQLESDTATLPQVLRPLCPPVPSAQDLHAISGTPLVLLPGSHAFVPVDVLSEPAPISAGQANEFYYASHAGITTLSPEKVSAHKTSRSPIIIQNNRAILLAPYRITPELIINPYRPAKHVASHLPTLPPALVSISPNNAIHHLERVTLRDIDLRSFLLHSFMQLVNQQSSKVYLIEHLTLDNDLQQHFTSPEKQATGLWGGLWKRMSKWWDKSPEPLDAPRITLYQVVVYVTGDRVDCYFVEPCQNGKTQGRHITYKVVNHHGKTLYKKQRELEKRNHLSSDTINLKLSTISGQRHRNVYNKYRKLFNRQKVGESLSSKRMTPVLAGWRGDK